MPEILFFLFLVVFVFFSIKVCEKKKIFVDFKKENHKRFVSKSNNLSIGGIIFFLFCVFLFFERNYFNVYFFIFLSLIFFLGFFSDIKIFKSPKLRFFLQFVFLISYILIDDLKIPLSNIHFIDFFFKKLLL